MRSRGRGGLGSSGHSTLLVTTVADADESEQLQLHDPTGAPTNQPLPAVAVTATSSSSSSRAATPPETCVLPDVDDEGVLVLRCALCYCQSVEKMRSLRTRASSNGSSSYMYRSI